MHKKMWYHLNAVLILTLLTLSACGGGATEAPAETEPAATEAPITEAPTEAPTEVPATEAPATEAPTEPPVIPDLATEVSVFYALPDSGIAYLLTPRQEAPGITAEELAEQPDALDNQVLATFKVVQQLSEELPVDDYTVTLDPGGEAVSFNGTSGAVLFPAVIRSLPLPLPDERPVAMISSVQMCLAWGTLQICALVSTPLPSDLVEQLDAAIQELGAEPGSFALDRSIPDVEGDGMVGICLAELIKDEPNYAECKATVLAAPILESLDPPTAAPDAVSTAVLVVLENLVLDNDVFSDPELTQLKGQLPPGNYLMYDIILPDDPVIGTYNEQPITASRVGLSTGVGQDPEAYLRAVIGAPLTGEAVQGAPPDGPEAVISNLWIRGWDGVWRCYFKERQCPWLQ